MEGKHEGKSLEVKVAKSAGFCFGVQRALDKVYTLLAQETLPIYTLGPLIHNEEVVRELTARGIQVIGEEEVDTVPTGIVVIRSHGVGKAVYEKLEAAGHRICDATCPFVLKIHRTVEKESKAGALIVITGDTYHPEVQGIRGWCVTEPVCIQSTQEARDLSLPEDRLVCVVSQTTFHLKKFQDIVEILRKKSYDIEHSSGKCRIINTICSATEERQMEARQIAAAADTMLVIGSRHSSNTQKLFEICSTECANTYYIQTPVDLDSDMFQCSSYVGITAGASTPKSIIEEVQKHVRENI